MGHFGRWNCRMGVVSESGLLLWLWEEVWGGMTLTAASGGGGTGDRLNSEDRTPQATEKPTLEPEQIPPSDEVGTTTKIRKVF